MIPDGFGRACRLVLDGMGRVLRPSDVYSFETKLRETINIDSKTIIEISLNCPILETP